MGRPTGSADLPLHGGRVPHWLSARMARLGRVIVEAIVLEYGRDELLRRLAHPFWFQALGSVMGMDWHSSGITTSVMGALKRGLQPVSAELGLYFCGGRGRQSRRTPEELRRVGERVGFDADELVRASRLVAKVDSAALQDGFDLYLHAFVVTQDGQWTVVQQGMDVGRRQARRYHWLSEGLEDFCEAPHSAIEGPERGQVLNLTDPRARPARAAQLELAAGGPEPVLTVLRRLREPSPTLFAAVPRPRLQMPAHHEVRASDVLLRRLHGVLAAAADNGPGDFADLLLRPELGARCVAALAFVAEIVHGTPARFSDPARFSLALGGKDGHPFPVPLDVYDATLGVLRRALEAARLGNDDRLAALQRLDRQARLLEGVGGPGFEEFVTRERMRVARWAGRRVGDGARDGARKAAAARGASSRPARGQNAQLELGL